MTGITLDAGALIAFERNRRDVVAVLRRAVEYGDEVCVPAPALAQVWRDGRRQARLARLVGAPTTTVVPLDDAAARASGQLCGAAGTSDVVDAAVVHCARRHGHAVLTSDPDDLATLDPAVPLVVV